MKIGELAHLTGVGVEAIRHYEREGLLPPTSRSASNYRMYHQGHVDQLLLIRHCRSMDMSLEEIRTLLRFSADPQQDCGPIDALLDSHLQHVSLRIRELRALEKQLKALRLQCSGAHPASDCGILGQLQARAKAPPMRARSHVRAAHQ